MFIGIDGNEANVTYRVGIGRYASQILTNLFENQKRKGREKNTFVVYLKNPPYNHLPQELPWWQYRVVGFKPLWTQIGLPATLYLQTNKPDVFFTPSHYAPRFSPCPSIISIMDLSYLYFPEMFRHKDLYQLRNWTSYSIKKATKILTISQHSKDDIIKNYKVQDSKIVVTYPGYDKEKFNIRNSKEKKTIFLKYGIQDKFILYVGTLQPRKNLYRLIKAYDLLIKKEKLRDYKLVLVGKKGWLYKDIFHEVETLGLTGKVIFTDFLDDEVLPYFYRNAKCFILPSLYEGFGLTAVEAMACGCPVIVSKVSSLPEITQKAGLYVDPYDVKEIKDTLCNVLVNNKLRTEMIKRGLKQVQKFSWQDCIQQTLHVLKGVNHDTISG